MEAVVSQPCSINTGCTLRPVVKHTVLAHVDPGNFDLETRSFSFRVFAKRYFYSRNDRTRDEECDVNFRRNLSCCVIYLFIYLFKEMKKRCQLREEIKRYRESNDTISRVCDSRESFSQCAKKIRATTISQNARDINLELMICFRLRSRLLVIESPR